MRKRRPCYTFKVGQRVKMPRQYGGGTKVIKQRFFDDIYNDEEMYVVVYDGIETDVLQSELEMINKF
jgi:hypothetical protein